MKIWLTVISFICVLQSWGQISLVKKNESCAGRNDGEIEVVFDGTTPGNANYSWTRDGQAFGGGQHLTGLKPGDYSVTVTIEGGCMAFKSARIYPGNEVSVDISARLIAVNPRPVRCGTYPEFTYKLTAVARGGTPPYYCSWGQRFDPGNGECTIEVSGTSIAVDVFISDSLGCADSDGWQKKSVKKICARDPNDITGPEGYDSLHWVSVHDEMNYVVRFENDPIFATANAAVVFISVPIDDDVNPFSFRLGSMGFGNKIIEVPSNVSSFQDRFDFSEELGFLLDVTAGLDIPNNRFIWLMETIDPVTGQPPLDPAAGFLPINDTLTGSGEGFITFTCKPKSSTFTGEIIGHQASIVFDANDPLLTNTWTNVIDAFPPLTASVDLQDTFYSNQIPFAWLTQDDPGGCGVKQSEIFLSEDNIVFESLGLMSDSSHTGITLDWNQTYYYKIIGTDNVDNTEDMPADSFYIMPHLEILVYAPDQRDYCFKDTLWVDAELIAMDEADLYISIDSGITFVPVATAVDTFPFPVLLDSTYLYPDVFIKVRNEENNIEAISDLFTVHGVPSIIAEGDPFMGCIGEILFVEASGANSYQWFPDTIMGSPSSRYSNIYTDVSQYAFVRGTDAYGCTGLDSIWLTIYPNSIDTIPQPLCEGDSVLINGQWETAEGFYPTTYVNVNGCDSVMVSEVYFESPCIWSGGLNVYVDHDAAGANNGTSWADAFTDLNDAIYVAGRYENVQEIWVAEGVYHPHPSLRDTSFVLKDSIKIYGGFLGTETMKEERSADPELVFLSGDINLVDTLWDNSFHNVVFSPSCVECVLDGLTIQYGYADQAGDDTGAGILNFGKGYIYNVVFERNFATELGAAVYSSGTGANLVFESCTFRLNTSSLGRDVVNVNGAQIQFAGLNSLY